MKGKNKLKLYFHYCPAGFSNCYLLGSGSFPDENEAPDSRGTAAPREAIIIDPGSMDSELLSIIEDNEYKLRGVFITHDHSHHVRGIRTILRIYDTEVYAINPVIREQRTVLIHDGETIRVGPFSVETISIPGHSADSAIYRVDRILFTGDTVSVGLTGSVASSYAAVNQETALRSKLLSLPGDYTVLPGHGPPTTLEAERRFNMDLNNLDRNKKATKSFNSMNIGLSDEIL